METLLEKDLGRNLSADQGGAEAPAYHIITYGCQMNKNDTERMSGMLENIGYREETDWQKAQLVILNTCSIRDKAERRVLGKFHELHHFRKKAGKDMRLAITGCMPQHARAFILEQLPFLDYVVGVNNMEMLPDLILSKVGLDSQLKLLRPNRKEDEVASYEEKLSIQKREKGPKAWVSIQFGCDKFCTYCIVPFTRGREYSRKKEDILREVDALQEKGFTEVVLLGQNVNSYGKTTYGDYLFSHLLADVAKRQWLTNIEFMTSHPHDVDEELIDVIASHENISKEIHFPLQHGDDVILEKMNRQYTVAEYLDKVALLRRKIPSARVGTDLIVGFPGETEEQFGNLIRVLHDVRFDWANTASYSARPGTKAERLSDQVPEEVKARRLRILNETLKNLRTPSAAVH